MPTKDQGDTGYIVPVDNPAKLIAWGERRWSEGRQNRPDFIPRISLYFYWGYHYLVYDSRQGRVRQARINKKDPNAPVRLHANILADVIDRTISKLTKHLPLPEGRPTTTNPDALASAKVATKLLASEWHRLDLEARIPEMYQWVVPVGWAFAQVTWNSEGGSYVGNIAITDPQTKKERVKDVYQGNIEFDIVPHFELAFSGPSLEDSRWAIREVAMTTDEVYEYLGVRLTADESKDATKRIASLSDDILQAQEYAGEGKRRGPAKVSVKQLWIPPGKMRTVPDGLVFTWVANVPIGEPKKWPYKHVKQVPFVQYNYLPPQGTPFGRSPTFDVLNLQMDFNDAISRMATIRRRLTPKMLIAEGSVNTAQLTSKYEIIPFKEGYGFSPTLQMPDGRWLQQYTEAMAIAELKINERFGMTDAARGELAGTSPGVTAITQKELQDDVRAAPSLQLNNAIKKTGNLIIQLIRQFWTEQRVTETYSKYGNLELMRFRGSDVTNEISIQVKAESGLPRSKSGRAQLFLELGQLIPSLQEDPTLLIHLLDLPPTDVLSLEFNRQKAKQEREIANMIEQEIVEQVNPLADDHSMHASVIIDFMQELDWEQLDDDERGRIEDHLLGHLALLGAQTDGQAGAQIGADPVGGAVPEGAGAPPGIPGEIPEPIPPVTELAMMGGHAGQPGPVPGVDDDITAALIGR